MKTKVEVMMTNPSYGDGRKAISITIRDEASHITIADVEISYEDFVVALNHGTGYGVAEVCVSENIGKQKENKKLEVDFDLTNLSDRERKEKAYVQAQTVCPEGWTVSNYFGSQGMLPYGKGKGWVNIYRYVDTKENKDEAI